MTPQLGSRYRWMIAMLAITAYLPTLKTGFMWDDHVMIEINPFIRGWSLPNLRHDFTTDVFDGRGDPYYRPLQTLANRVDYTLWGLQPVGYHITNLLFHLGNAILVAELILLLGFSALAAFLTASLFAVHPIVVEQLMIIAGRAELMGLFFSLLALILFLKEGRRWAFAGGAAFIAALLVKESTIVLPALLALVFYIRKEPHARYKLPAALLLAIPPYLLLRYRIVGPVIAHSDPWLTARFFIQEFPSVLGRYIRLLCFPWNLHSHRLLPHLNHFWPLHLLVLAAGCYAAIRRWGRLGVFCIGWFIVMLLPKTPVMIYGNFMLEHWGYPAAIAFFLPLGLLIAQGWQSRRKNIRTMTAIGYFSLLIAWSLLVHLNVALRGSDEQMYRWALHFTSSNPIKYNLGVLLLQEGRPREAATYFEEVAAAYPDNADAIGALAEAYWVSGHRQAAIGLLTQFIHTHPDAEALRKTLKSLQQGREKKTIQ
jgi:hypothetical protein